MRIISFVLLIMISSSILANNRHIALTPYLSTSDATIKQLPEDSKFRSRVSGYGLGAGFFPVDWFGVELRYFSREDLDFIFDEGDGDFDVISRDVVFHLRKPLGSIMHLRGKLGYSAWEAEGFTRNRFSLSLDTPDTAGGSIARIFWPWSFTEFDEGTRFSGDGESPIYGFGIGIALGALVELSIDYERLNDRLEMDNYLFGVSFRF